MESKIIHGDCMEELKKLPDSSVDCIVTDPPYQITACKWDEECLKDDIPDNYIFQSRIKNISEIIKNIKRKRPIQNKRLDSFSWWIYVEKVIQDELLKYKMENLK